MTLSNAQKINLLNVAAKIFTAGECRALWRQLCLPWPAAPGEIKNQRLDNRPAAPDGGQGGDSVAAFIEQCVEQVPEEYGCRVQAIVMYQLYCAWARATGRHETSRKWFNRRLKSLGFTQTKSSVMYWQDVHILYSPAAVERATEWEAGRISAGPA